jgi:SAM-dependent methyltransferase
MRVLEVGCGIGQVALQMARCVGPSGRVMAIDLDGPFLELAREEAERQAIGNITFQRCRIEELDEESAYDLVYSRFLLSHLPDPAAALTRMARSARRGGMLVVEDIDGSGRFCYPTNRAFQRLIELYDAIVRRQGADPNIGPRLPDLLEEAGVLPVHLDVFTPTYRFGEGKRLPCFDLEGIRASVVAGNLATHAEIDALVQELHVFAENPRSLLSLPRIFQVWGPVRKGTAPWGERDPEGIVDDFGLDEH